jgi:hypothetical protein
MSTNYAFQPEAVEALATAFHKSWSFISDDPCFARQDPSLLQRLLSVCLMQSAADGEHDPLRLANAAIYRMRHEHSSEAQLQCAAVALAPARRVNSSNPAATRSRTPMTANVSE